MLAVGAVPVLVRDVEESRLYAARVPASVTLVTEQHQVGLVELAAR